MLGFKIIGTGSYLPSKIISNFDLEKIMDTSNEWIFQRTGIKERRIAEKSEKVYDIATKAAINAIENAKINKEEIDCIIVATTTHENKYPSCAIFVHSLLGIKKNIPCFDVSAACSGFLYALITANSYLQTKKYKNILIIGADKNSDIINWNDRSTAVLFGDGAGAVIISSTELDVSLQNKNSGIIDFNLYSDSSRIEDLKVNDFNQIEMNGNVVFKNAVKNLSDCLIKILENNNLKSKDITKIIPHQANMRIIESLAQKIDIPIEKVATNLEKYGNTSAASIPILLKEEYDKKTIKSGDLIIIEAIGAGLTWGSILIRI